MLCTLDDVKTSPAMDKIRQVTPDAYDEEYIENQIKAFTALAEGVCGRKFKYGTYTEVFTVTSDQSSVQLSAFPIESITSVKDNYNGDFSGAATYDSSQYGLYDGGISGLLKLRNFQFLGGVGTVQVVYIGGYSTIPNDLRMAAIDQVAHNFLVAPTSYMQSGSQNDGSVTYSDGNLLPHVRTVLRRYQVFRV